MTVTISITGDLRLDQSAGLQSGGSPDKDDIALSDQLVASPDPLPSTFKSFLDGLSLTQAQRDNAETYGAAREDSGTGYFINVATDGEPINDLFFSQANGTLFNGQIATDGGVNLTVAGGTDPIYLYSFASGDILIGSTEAPADVDITDPTSLDGSKLVFAYYLEENGTHTGADVWGVVFQPIEHVVDGASTAQHDDTLDFGDFLNVSATGNVSFDFDELRSGKFLWVALGTETAGLLLTGRDLNVQSGGRKDGLIVSGTNDPSDAVNTSQGGTGATTGINNQMYTPGSVGVITFVTGFDPLPTGTSDDAVGDNVKDIQYDGYIDVTTAGVFISQTQGSGTVNMTIGLYEADADKNDPDLDPETGFNYIGAEGGNNNNSGAFIDDTDVAVTTVVVKLGNTTIGTWNSGNDNTNIGGVTVDLDGNEAHVTGLAAGMEVFVSSGSGETFNRLQVSADTGTTTFDIGRVDLTQAVTDVENIGGSILIHDDGPSIAVNDATGSFVEAPAVAATSTWTNDPGTDGFQSISLNFDSYTVDGGAAVSVDTSLGTLTDTDSNGNYVFTGTVTADFTPNDGIDNPQDVDFTLTLDPDADSYSLTLDTPPSTVTTFDTSQGSLRAGGPDAVQTLEFAPTGPENDIVFFGAVATAPTSNVSGSNNDLLDLISPDPDLTETQLEALNVPSLINTSTKMNVSTSGIGINNNNLDGSGAGISSGDESFMVNPEQDVGTVKVFIDNSVGGYTPGSEQLYYTIYYTDGTVSAPILVQAGNLSNATQSDPKAAQGGKYFLIDGLDKQIDAVQLTMGTGTVKIPVIQFTIEQDFVPEPLSLDFTVDLVDGDGDNQEEFLLG